MVKLACYSDEVSDDPAKACALLVSENIEQVVLRNAWCRPINTMSDSACGTLDDILKQHKLSPVLLHTTIGDVPTSELVMQISLLKRALLVCAYFKCKAIAISLGRTIKSDKVNEQITSWLTTVTRMCLTSNILPVYEIAPTCHVFDPTALAIVLSKFRRLKLIYDPAQLVAQRKLDPFIKYWSLLKSSVAYLDIHDYRSGEAAKPAGYGDGQLDITISDAISSNFNGIYCLEPGLGKRYNTLQTKEEVFVHALKACRELFARTDVRKIS